MDPRSPGKRNNAPPPRQPSTAQPQGTQSQLQRQITSPSSSQMMRSLTPSSRKETLGGLASHAHAVMANPNCTDRSAMRYNNNHATDEVEETRYSQDKAVLSEHIDMPIPWDNGRTIRDFQGMLLRASAIAQRAMLDNWYARMTFHFDISAVMLVAFNDWLRTQPKIMAHYGGEKGFNAAYPVPADLDKWKRERMTQHRSSVTFFKQHHAPFWAEYCIPFCKSLPQTTQGVIHMAYCLRRFDLDDLRPALNSIVLNRLRAPSNHRDKRHYLIGQDWTDCKGFIAALSDYTKGTFCDYEAGKPPTQDHISLYNTLLSTGHLRGGLLVDTMSRFDEARYQGWRNMIQPFRDTQPKNRARGNEPWFVDMPDSDTLKKAHGVALHSRWGLPIPAHLANMVPGRLGPAGSTTAMLPEDRAEQYTQAVDEVSMLGRMTGVRGGAESKALAAGIEAATAAASAIADLWGGCGNENEEPALAGPMPSRQLRSQARQRLEDENPELLDELDAAITEAGEESSLYDDDGAPDEMETEEIRDKTPCECADQKSVLVQLLTKIADTRQRKQAASTQVKLLRAWWVEIVDRSQKRSANGQRARDIHRVCWRHTKFLAGQLGIQYRSLTQAHMAALMEVLYTHPSKWAEYYEHPKYRILFRAGFRREYDNKDMLSYRFRPSKRDFKIDWKAVIKAMGWEAHVDEFKRTGTVVIDVFSWMFKDRKMVEIIDQSFDCFRWHQRRIGGKANLGWNRVMFHSIPQQLVRGDLEYWLLYACLREQHTLISYPYYTKYALEDDRTEFKHIDLNIAQAAKYGKGVDMIQGSVSFDQEDKHNCTIMMDGFHHIASAYVDLRKELGLPIKTGHIEAWDHKADWPKQAAERWPEVKFVDKICKPGEVRISHPLLPHGTGGPSKKVRRTILPWLVLVTKDHETMENPAMGSYQQIAEAHRNLVAAPSTPSGYPNKYGGIAWAMPGVAIPRFSSSVSRAIHCQERWDSPVVEEELRKNLQRNPTGESIRAWISGHRAKSVEMAKEHWEIFKLGESMAYSANYPEEGRDVDESEGESRVWDVPDRSFFHTSEERKQELMKEKRWAAHDADMGTKEVLAEMIQEQIAGEYSWMWSVDPEEVAEPAPYLPAPDTPSQSSRSTPARSRTGSPALLSRSRQGSEPSQHSRPAKRPRSGTAHVASPLSPLTPTDGLEARNPHLVEGGPSPMHGVIQSHQEQGTPTPGPHEQGQGRGRGAPQ